jgi:hypothetical protein
MKKFTSINKFAKINEREITLDNNQNVEEVNTEIVTQDNPKITVNVSSISDGKVKSEEADDKEYATNASGFISKLFESREMAHIYHLQVKGDTGSHAVHMAMSDYYTNVLEMIDDLSEIYMGQYDIIENYNMIDTNNTKNKDVLEYFKELSEYIKSNKYNSFNKEDSHLQNIIDEVLGLVYKTIYKLRFTK